VEQTRGAGLGFWQIGSDHKKPVWREECRGLFETDDLPEK